MELSEINRLYKEGCEEVNKKLGESIKDGESVLERFKLSNKLIHGYNQNRPIERALGVPITIQRINVMNHDDVVNSVDWLLDHGFDIVKVGKNGSLHGYVKRSGPGEYRLVVREDGSCYIHPSGRNGETYDFATNF